MNGPVLIAGIGNIFLGDDAFGVEVIKSLRGRGPGENGASVRVVDFGIRGLDLAYALLEKWEMVILVDATRRGEAPGTLYLLAPEMPQPRGDGRIPPMDGHALDPLAVLELAAALGAPACTLRVVGCEPSPMPADTDDAPYLDMSAGLSLPVRCAVPQAVRIIEEILAGRRCPEPAVS